MHLQRTTYTVILAGATAWCTMILLAPYLASTSSALAEFVYGTFHPICHQLPERSFHLFGGKLGVCMRCSSIYFAFLAGTLAYPLLGRRSGILRHSSRHARAILALIVLPMVLDAGLELTGLRDSTLLSRTLTGGMFGLVIPFILLPVVLEAVQQIFTRPHSPSMNN